jgi:single-strand DNA-binding protein
VLVDAELDWREWNDQQDNKREAVALRARQVVFEGSRSAPATGRDGAGAKNGGAPDEVERVEPERVVAASAGSEASASADDLPF